jgi:hypothetical protein
MVSCTKTANAQINKMSADNFKSRYTSNDLEELKILLERASLYIVQKLLVKLLKSNYREEFEWANGIYAKRMHQEILAGAKKFPLPSGKGRY